GAGRRGPARPGAHPRARTALRARPSARPAGRKAGKARRRAARRSPGRPEGHSSRTHARPATKPNRPPRVAIIQKGMSIFDRRRLPPEVFKLDTDRMRVGWYSDKYFINIARTLAELAARGYRFGGTAPD